MATDAMYSRLSVEKALVADSVAILDRMICGYANATVRRHTDFDSCLVGHLERRGRGVVVIHRRMTRCVEPLRSLNQTAAPGWRTETTPIATLVHGQVRLSIKAGDWSGRHLHADFAPPVVTFGVELSMGVWSVAARREFVETGEKNDKTSLGEGVLDAQGVARTKRARGGMSRCKVARGHFPHMEQATAGDQRIAKHGCMDGASLIPPACWRPCQPHAAP